MWVVNAHDSSLSRIDPVSATVTATIPIGGGQLSRIAVGGGAVWVGEYDKGTVARIDPGTNTVVAHIAVPPHPVGIAMGNGAVWVATSGSGDLMDQAAHAGDPLSRIDPVTNAVENHPLGRLPADVAVGYGQVWVVFSGSNNAVQIDPNTGKAIQSVDTGTNSISVAIGDGAVWVVHPFAAGVKSTEGKPGTVTRVSLTATSSSASG